MLSKALPSAYQNENWDAIPRPLMLAENLLRLIVFISCAFLQLEIKQRIQCIGLIVYTIGLVLYFTSWILQMRFNKLGLSQSILAFTAPAYTSAIWLGGIGLIGQHSLIDVWYSYWIFILLSLAFAAVHTLHSLLAFKNWNRTKRLLQ